MPWWMDLVLLISSVVLWLKGGEHTDDVWSFFQKLLAFLAVMVVLLGGRWVPLEIVALALAIWLPSAARFDQEDRSI
jgi:hypothetical protein